MNKRGQKSAFGFALLVVAAIYIIASFGLIQPFKEFLDTARDTTELNHSKVESFTVHQPILGRIFGFGTLTINGTGGIAIPIPDVDDPLQFRKKAMQIIDATSN